MLVMQLGSNGGLFGSPLELFNTQGYRVQPQDIDYSPTNDLYYICGRARHSGGRDGMVAVLDNALMPLGNQFHSYSTVYNVPPQPADYILRRAITEASGDVSFVGSAGHNNTMGVQGGVWHLRTDPTGFEPNMCHDVPDLFAQNYGLTDDTDPSQTPFAITLEIAIPDTVIEVQQASSCPDYLAFKTQNEPIAQEAENTDLLVFPNPSTGATQIIIPVEDDAQWQLQLFDMMGRAATPIRYVNQGSTQLNVSDLAPGTYIVHASNGNQVRMQRLVVE